MYSKGNGEQPKVIFFYYISLLLFGHPLVCFPQFWYLYLYLYLHLYLYLYLNLISITLSICLYPSCHQMYSRRVDRRQPKARICFRNCSNEVSSSWYIYIYLSLYLSIYSSLSNLYHLLYRLILGKWNRIQISFSSMEYVGTLSVLLQVIPLLLRLWFLYKNRI